MKGGVSRLFPKAPPLLTSFKKKLQVRSRRNPTQLRDLPPFVGIAPPGYVLCSCHIVYRNLTAFSPFGQRGAFS
uniref:Uncharacterized protein n=5 Tax=Enterobacteriaceae TaxID=543 RepID=A0A6D1IU97_ECOLX|nr:hypothetical protein [Escherichia coli]QWP89770.1 hypothetical protein [Salmonella enterica subsp. enterica serovar Kottbus]